MGRFQFEPKIVDVDHAWIFAPEYRSAYQILIFIGHGPDRNQINIFLGLGNFGFCNLNPALLC